MAEITSVCVYCGSQMGNDPRHRETAAAFGRELAGQGVALVYGGGRIGLMGVVADAVLQAGGKVIGIIPTFLNKVEIGHQHVTELHVVESMHTRKHKMFEMADAFVILPGGLGTLDEAFEIITWRQLNLHDKPIILVNHQNYWQPFLALFDAVIEGGFASVASRRLFTVVDSPAGVLDAIRAAGPEGVPERPERL